MGSLRSSMMTDKDEELALFNEMRRQEKEGIDLLLFQKSDEFVLGFGSKDGNSPILDVGACTPARKTVADEFLNSENDKNDYDWLLTPPGTPLFPSLEMESQKTVMNQLGTLKARPTALKSRLANPPETTVRSNFTSRQPPSSPGLSTSISGVRRPFSSSGARPSTPTNRSKPALNTATKISTTTPPSRPSRPATPTSRGPLTSSTKPTVTPRSSTPTRQPVLASKHTSRSATPTRRPMTNTSAPPSSSSIAKSPRPWKPSDIPGFALDAPPNLRTSLPDRGRPGITTARSSSVEPVANGGRVRRQSCSPARGRPPNGSGSSVPIPAMSRLHAKANENVSPVVLGTQMVERVVNMRRLAPPKQENKPSPNGNLSAKSSSSPDSSGFGRNLSKKSLDMAIRHMDIRRTIPSNLRPLMANIPASSLYSVRAGPGRGRTVSVSEVSVSNNALCADANEADEDIISCKVPQFPQGR